MRLVSIPGDPAVGREDLRLAGGLEGLPGHEPAPPPPPPGNIEEKLWLALGRGVAVALGTPLLRLGVLNAVEVGGGGNQQDEGGGNPGPVRVSWSIHTGGGI